MPSEIHELVDPSPRGSEEPNNLVKRVKRAAFGFRSFSSFRVRTLLYAGKPNWSLLETVMPR